MTINRKNDYAFKRIFGHEDTKDILAGFLSAVLEVPIRPEELTLIPTELNPEYLADKASRFGYSCSAQRIPRKNERGNATG
jgi:predicted transposase/invertase (TIGR01784 family)